MAITKEEVKTQYPLPVYNFRVEVDGQAMSFSEVSGLNIEFEKVVYRHGLSFWEGEGIKKYFYDKYVPVTFKKGTIRGTNVLYDWLSRKSSSIKMVVVSLCDENGQPVVSWRIKKAVPTKLTAPTFDASANDVSVEELEIMAAGISVEHH